MNPADKNGFCPLSSSTSFTIPGRGGSIMDVQPIRVVSPVLSASHLQLAFVPPNHRHPPPYTHYIYSVFETVEAGGENEQTDSLRGQNQEKFIQVPDIRCSAQGAEMGADKNPQMEAAKDGFTERIQLDIENSNQILEGEGDFVERMLKLEVLSSNFISLCWNNCHCSRLPSFPMQDLRVLEVNGRKLGRLWEDEDQEPQQLLQLNIDAPLLELPKSLGKLRHLEKIVLKSTRLTTMPDSLWDLRNLQHIALEGCEKLGMLPDSLGNLTNLRHLDLNMCKSLRVLPDSMEKLTKLEFINLDSCKNLEKLPNSLLEFPNIHCTQAIRYDDHDGIHINLSSFPCLKMVPDSLKYMRSLASISLTGCESLKSLPIFLGELTYLVNINLGYCKSLEMLPDSLEKLKYLQIINLSGCESLKRLPDSLGKLKSRHLINLGHCKSLEMLSDSLENLKDLHYINLSGCESLKRLPDFLGKLKSLYFIKLEYCKSLEMLPDSLENLKDPHYINLSGCEILKRLPDSLGKLKSLTSINLGLCKSLEMLPDSFQNLQDLSAIDLSGCKSLKRLPNSWR